MGKTHRGARVTCGVERDKLPGGEGGAFEELKGLQAVPAGKRGGGQLGGSCGKKPSEGMEACVGFGKGWFRM